MNNDQDMDLGFEIGQDTNLFELFAKGQDGDTPKAVDLADADVTKPAEPSKTSATKTEPTTTESTDPKPEPTVDAEKIKELLDKQKAEGIKGDNKTEGDESTEEGDDTNADDNPLSIVFNDFKEKGIIQVPDDFEFDGTEEGLQEALQATVQNQLAGAVDQTIDEAFEKNPANAPVAKDLIKFLGAGGNIADFVADRQDLAIKPEDFDSDDEAVRTAAAKRTLTNYYKDVMGWSPDRIKRQIERSAAKGEDILVDEAKDFFEEYKAHMEKRRADNLEKVTTADNKRKQQILDFNTKLSESIDTADEVAGFKLTDKKSREALKDYMFKPTVELNGKRVPQYLADRHRLQNDPSFVMAQALWLKNGMKPDTKTVETKVTGKLAQKLADMQKGKKTAQTASGQGIENTNRSTPGLLDFDNMEVINL